MTAKTTPITNEKKNRCIPVNCVFLFYRSISVFFDLSLEKIVFGESVHKTTGNSGRDIAANDLVFVY